MAARYKEEAERWKCRLQESEAHNVRLQHEIADLRKALKAARRHQDDEEIHQSWKLAASRGHVETTLIKVDSVDHTMTSSMMDEAAARCRDSVMTPPHSM